MSEEKCGSEARSLYRAYEVEDDSYTPCVEVRPDKSVRLGVGGYVIQNTIKGWHSQAKELANLRTENQSLRERLEKAEAIAILQSDTINSLETRLGLLQDADKLAVSQASVIENKDAALKTVADASPDIVAPAFSFIARKALSLQPTSEAGAEMLREIERLRNIERAAKDMSRQVEIGGGHVRVLWSAWSNLEAAIQSPGVGDGSKKQEWYASDGTTKYGGMDPEVTCASCKRTFLTDPMDACCRQCHMPFSLARIPEFFPHGVPEKIKTRLAEIEKEDSQPIAGMTAKEK